MPSFDDFTDLYASIALHWDKAEEDIKVAEQINHKASLPAIKELRYAGRRIVEAFKAISECESKEKIESILKDAEFDCLRARHDSIDAATSKIALDMEIASERLGAEPITTAFPEFSSLWEELSAIRE